MLVAGEEKMGKTFLINKMVYHCRQEGVPLVHIDFRNQSAANFLWMARQVRDQLEPWTGPEPFHPISILINRFTDPALAGVSGGAIAGFVDLDLLLPGSSIELEVRVDLTALQNHLQARFTLEEMYGLARSIHLLPDDIPGSTRSAYAAELVAYCRRRAYLADLVTACESQRPAADWWSERPEGEEQAAPAVEAGRPVVDQRRDTLPRERQVLALAQSQIDGATRDAPRRASSDQAIALLFDTYDEATDEAMAWIDNNLLDPIGNRFFQKLAVIVAGRPPLPEAGNRLPYVGGTTLQPFTVDHIREYLLEKRGIKDEDPAALFRYTKGKPGLLAGIAANLVPAPARPADDW